MEEGEGHSITLYLVSPSGRIILDNGLSRTLPSASNTWKFLIYLAVSGGKLSTRLAAEHIWPHEKFEETLHLDRLRQMASRLRKQLNGIKLFRCTFDEVYLCNNTLLLEEAKGL